MSGHIIRLSRNDSVFSVNKENTVDVKLKASSKLLPYPDYIGAVNSQTVYENERNACNKYRLIVTINPYCSNVLFNTFTEIVKDEGSENVKRISDGMEYTRSELTENDVYGKESGITRRYMIDNTEYSNTEHGYVYLPGTDMFSNHILRNKSFKMVCDYSEKKTENREVFNTIADYMRYADGKNIHYNTTLYENNDFKLKYNENENNTNLKHLYDKDDILGFEDGTVFNERLVENNGWYGFKNNSSVPSKTSDGKNPMYVERVFNNYDGCEFVDMYPDRSLFSFSPKFNPYRRRLEYNWDICITYPYRNEYDYELVNYEDKSINSLKIMYVERMYGVHGEDILMFRTYSNHGLKKGSMFAIYIEGNGYVTNGENERVFLDDEISNTKKQDVKLYRVYNVGDLDANNNGHYFYINDLSLLDVLGIGRDKTLKETNSELYKKRFRFNRCKGNKLSSYYLRLFKKIPNFKWRKRNLTEDIAKGEGNVKFDDFVKDNASDKDGYMYGFDNEQYRLAFSNTIYNDDITQITFTDDIDIEYLRDNLGRKVTTVYVTLVKTNRGNEKWYGGNDIKSDEIEYSHAFGKVSSGIKFLSVGNDKYNYILNDDDDTNKRNLKKERGALSDVSFMNNLNLFDSSRLEEDITFRGGKYKDENDTFLGDLVDFNPNECVENVLDSVMHRFNTYQREMGDGYLKKFVYREIMTDDYDKDDFALGSETKTDYIDISTETYKVDEIDLRIWQRPEGYYYKPHYPMLFRELSPVRQLSHFEVKVKKCKPVQLDGIYISVSTKLPHNVPFGESIYICDDLNSKQKYNSEKRKFEIEGWYNGNVVYIEDKYNFVMTVPSIGDLNWCEICGKINDGEYVIRRKNDEIPEHSFKIGNNKFIWRDTISVGDLETVDLPDYTFTNGSFYVNNEINFFLRRQDSENINGLYAGHIFPNDIEGKVMEESNYVYKEEGNEVC